MGKSLYILLHLIIWGAFCFILYPEPAGLGLFRSPLFAPEDQGLFLLYGTLLNAVMVYSYAHIALPRYLQGTSLPYFLTINSAYVLGFVLVESCIDYAYSRQVYRSGLYTQEPLLFTDWLTINAVVSGAFMVAANLYGFTFGWFREQHKLRELEQEKLRAELLALKHQINPHFLFNILNGLYALAFKHNDEPTAEGIAKLSQMMRYMLYESNGPHAPMSREIEYIRNYIDLQQLRLNGLTQVDFQVRGEVEGKEIVPMVLIPFIENAFKHGISSVHPSEIRISIDLAGKTLFFEVENTVHPGQAGAVREPGGIGLQNVKKRLDLLYEDAYQLTAESAGNLYRVNLIISL
ncbi:MAG: histidine kinase [Bacteroidia bacterium]|nr:histidine kinase [Bacteroidia bacterium]